MIEAGIIKTNDAFLKQFNGKEVKLPLAGNRSTGKSGETEMYHFAGQAVGLYLRQDQIQAAIAA